MDGFDILDIVALVLFNPSSCLIFRRDSAGMFMIINLGSLAMFCYVKFHQWVDYRKSKYIILYKGRSVEESITPPFME